MSVSVVGGCVSGVDDCTSVGVCFSVDGVSVMYVLVVFVFVFVFVLVLVVFFLGWCCWFWCCWFWWCTCKRL